MKTKIELQAEAKEVSESTGCNIIYANDKGEFFTSKNLALNSDKKEHIHTFDFSIKATNEPIKNYKITAKDIKAYPELTAAELKEGDELDFDLSKTPKEQLAQLLGKK